MKNKFKKKKSSKGLKYFLKIMKIYEQ